MKAYALLRVGVYLRGICGIYTEIEKARVAFFKFKNWLVFKGRYNKKPCRMPFSG
jgi:hypothetical protein